MTWSEHDWSIYSKGIAKMLQKSVQKVLGSIHTFFKTWSNCQSSHVYKKLRCNEHDWSIFRKGIAKMLQKVCEKCSNQLVLFSKLDRIANLVMFTKKYDAIWTWLINLWGLQILKVAKRGRKALGSICKIWQYSILANIGSFWQSFAQIKEISRIKESTG